jgi:hypothetical protein
LYSGCVQYLSSVGEIGRNELGDGLVWYQSIAFKE